LARSGLRATTRSTSRTSTWGSGTRGIRADMWTRSACSHLESPRRHLHRRSRSSRRWPCRRLSPCRRRRSPLRRHISRRSPTPRPPWWRQPRSLIEDDARCRARRGRAMRRLRTESAPRPLGGRRLLRRGPAVEVSSGALRRGAFPARGRLFGRPSARSGLHVSVRIHPLHGVRGRPRGRGLRSRTFRRPWRLRSPVRPGVWGSPRCWG